MTAPQAPAPAPQPTLVTIANFWVMWLSMIAYGIVHSFLAYVIIAWSLSESPLVNLPFGGLQRVGLLYLVIVVGFVAVTYFGLGLRFIALGFMAGYILLTICSAGTCTFMKPFSQFDDVIVGSVLFYPLALLIFFVTLVIATYIRRAVIQIKENL